jgi:hypothetical protein
VKELQTLESNLLFCFYFLYSLMHKETLLAEMQDIFSLAQKMMNNED